MAESRHTAQTGGHLPLSVHRAFVVQLGAEADVAQGRVVGRVEHVVSGQATHFHSLEELLAFMAWVLQEAETAGGEQ
jgi:hypothetical protein